MLNEIKKVLLEYYKKVYEIDGILQQFEELVEEYIEQGGNIKELNDLMNTLNNEKTIEKEIVKEGFKTLINKKNEKTN